MKARGAKTDGFSADRGLRTAASEEGASLDIAVVIPTRNRPDDLGITVRSILAQSILPEQVVIIDQSDADESWRRVQEELADAPDNVGTLVHLQYIHDRTIPGLTAARNRAIALVSCAITLFLDDDVVLERNFIGAIQDTYRRDSTVAGVSGIITNYRAPLLAVRFWKHVFARGPFHDDRQPVYWMAGKLVDKEPIRVTRLGGGLMSFRTAAIRSVRFDENLAGACEGEDVDFCSRLGRDAILVITPEARLIHKQTLVARSAQHWLARDVRTAWYLYRRNWNHGLLNRLYFVWLNAGYLVVAAIIALRRLSVTPVLEVFKAIRQSRDLLRPPVGRVLRRDA